MAFPGGSDGKESACNVGDLGSIPGLGRSPGGGHSNPPQYSCLENPKDRGGCQTTMHRVTKSRARLSDEHFHFHFKTTRALPCFSGHHVLSHSVVSDFVTIRTVVLQASPAMGFSRQECWSGLPFPPPGDLPDPGMEPVSPAPQVDSSPLRPRGSLVSIIIIRIIIS